MPEPGYQCEFEATAVLGAAGLPGKDLLGGRAWDKGALRVLSLDYGF